jgi:amino acid adenylation domain-containing protein
LNAEYKTDVYSEQMISQFLESYEAVVEGFLKEEYLRDINIATKSQVELLDSFNQTDLPYDDTQTIVSLFCQQAKATPDNIAVVFKDKKYTYKQMDDISDRIAGYIVESLKLRDKSEELNCQLSTQEPVVSILIPRSEWMAIASLGVLKAGCAYQPLDPSYPKERLNFMMQDASAKLLIADEELRGVVDEYQGEVLLTKDIEKLPALTEEGKSQLSIVNFQLKPDRLFILLYTSGSTGVPKGCQLEHGNLVSFCHWYQRYYDLKPEHNVAAYASYGFDACMMDMYPALTCGASVYIIPEELRLDLIALNEYFEQNNITHSFMTTQVGYQFATSIENHSLKHLSVGGEKLATLTPPTNYQFHNGYGPTECTIFTTTYPVEKKQKEIPIGKPTDNTHLYIVDSHGHRMPVGAAGELWISGPQVGRGYLNRPEKTAEVYINNPFSDDEKYVHVYRSGDVVRYLPDGNIQFVGRRDGQVKIRGFRIELKEVEAVIREFPGIKDATVQAFDEEGGGKFIAAYIVSDQEIDIEALNDFILDQKPPYMVPAVTMQIDAIPLNQNQKVNKKALPKPEKKSDGRGENSESAAPLNILEQEIHHIIAEIINTEDFGVTTILGYVGLTSIMSIKLAIQINKRFGVTLDSKALAKTGSVQSIENEILKVMMSGGGAANKEVDEVKHADMSNIPLSYAQMGVYVDCMKQPTSTVYNIPAAIRFPKGTDVQLFSKSVETIIKAHPQFHVHFDSQGGDIIQIIDENQPVVIAQSKLDEAEIKKYMVEFVKPFNLRQGPLYRMEIVSTEEYVYLLADVHHLIFDGASFNLFLDQLCDLMNGKDIEPERFTYADFVAAQKEAENSEEYAEARDFFQERLGKIEGVTEVPADLTNPLEQGVVETLYCPLNFDEIDSFCRQRNISPAHHILAATFYALSRFTNNEQLCITTISNGRSDLRISNTVGMFVNTLALSAFIEEQSVMEFLNETSKNFDETLRHESYPFARIASDYDLSAEIMFAYQMGVLEGHEYKGQPVTMELFESDAPKFRIAFYIQNNPEGRPSICLQYDNGRYSQELMQSLAQSISNAANAFIANPDAKLKSVSLLDDKQTTLLDSFNNTDVPYDNTQTVISLFRKQVESVPDNIAVIYHDVRLTYKQVDEMSDRIAAYLIRKELKSEDIVSIIIPRSEWMVIASLGVLKAGCAYQPLDPSYPKERLNFMMQDASAKLLIADEELRDVVDEYQGEVLLTKEIEKLPALTEEGKSQLSIVNCQLKPDSLFILLYTSGSTGVPKGCQLEHGNLVCFCHWYQRFYDLKPGDKVAAYASYGFDACMMDMYPALTTGATVVIVGEDIRLNLPDLNAYFDEEGVTHSFMTTQVGCQFAMNCDNHSLRHLSVGGEKILPLTPPENYKFHNAYGPTECTIFTTTYQQTEFEQNAPIGKPLDNLQLFIVDKEMNRLPLGAAGEMLVAGPQVSRGYLNLPEKTAETYIQWNGKRCYRTGDVVRYLADGNIQFVGRRDGQVKIRGFRIELKEVESVIREFPGIKDATVQAFDYENGGKFIAAYIVSDEQIDIKELNDFIGKQKPSYMIPAATMQIDSIPLNQNQKVNKKALPAPVVQAVDHKYVEPANDTEKLFCSIFGEVLSMDKIGATDNFFELGGTSLMVTKVIIEADKAGHHVAYGDVFTHATPRLLAQLVTGDTPVENDDDEVTNFDYSGINAILQQNNAESFRKGELQKLGNVLLTGATGYLGIHVLRELIDSDAPTITCLVRAQDQPAAERRLKNLLFYYFETSFKELFGTRLFVINGDVTQDMTKVVGDSIANINTVFNCAANVKHFSKTSDIEDVNIGGAQRCVEFCLQTGAKLVHISTTSVGEMWVIRNNGEEIPKLDERKFWFGQFLDNRYIHSKFLAERIVLDAVAHHGLSGKVMRVGNLAPRSYDGEFQVNFNSNSYMGRLKVFSTLGCCPYDSYDESIEMSPINETAKAVVLLASTPKECTVFQPFNNHTELLGDILQLLSKVERNINFVENEEFEKALAEAGQDQEKAKLLSAMMAYQDMAHGQKAVFINRDNRYTCSVLHRLGFHWSDTAWDYIERMLTAISGFGYFE